MNEREVHQLLVEASAIDNRTVTKFTVAAWFPIVGRYEYADAVAAMRSHFATSRDYLMPVHIAEGCRAIIRDRGPVPPPGHRWAVDAIEGRPVQGKPAIEGNQNAGR